MGGKPGMAWHFQRLGDRRRGGLARVTGVMATALWSGSRIGGAGRALPSPPVRSAGRSGRTRKTRRRRGGHLGQVT